MRAYALPPAQGTLRSSDAVAFVDFGTDRGVAARAWTWCSARRKLLRILFIHPWSR